MTRYGRGRVMERSGTGLTVTMVSAGMLTRCSGREPLAVLGFHPSDCYIQQLGVYELCITIAFFQSGFVTDG